MRDQALVSVIMVVRNGERFLRQAIDSVLAQDYRPFEIILVDGQSSDRTAEIARSYPSIHYVLQENMGIPNAYNLGIETARGEFVAFLSHDDLWTPDKLSVQAGYLMAHPDIEYVIAATRFFLEPGCPFPSHALRTEILDGNRVIRMMEIVMMRKGVFERAGWFDPSLDTAEDIDWFARAQDRHIPMAVLPEVLLHKRIHDGNTTLYLDAHRANIMRALRRSAERKRRMAPGEPR